MPDTIKYRRILLKLSGEALKGPLPYGVDADSTLAVCSRIKTLWDQGVQVALVVGGGNIFRGLGASQAGMDRVAADNMGMLATVMNAVALQFAFEKLGVPTRVQTAIEMHQIAEPFIARRAIRHLEKGRVVIFAGGTGNPFFTTDSAAALRASELRADAILKGTKVDGIYSADPKVEPTAVLLPHVTYQEVLEKRLGVMDAASIALCRESRIPIRVFNLLVPGNIQRVVTGEQIGSTVDAGEPAN